MRFTWWLSFLISFANARELDPSACSSRFDVQKDKIIRTEESREMGARYLSELDVGSRHECLRLCCETEACDVFVYEEKSPGSCYLFNCGPPEDFRCKFTAHGNFSSGVLELSRRLAELQDQERLARHEEELAKLRLSTTTVSTTTLSTAAPLPVQPQRLPNQPQTPQRRCSRYQFECHSGGECIAVYNACDGIPQCADGSDEAPELGCPSAPPLDVVFTTAKVPVKPVEAAAPVEAAPDAAAKDRWPHRLTQAQPQYRFAPESVPSSHIFSHKGGLLQEPENNALSNNMMSQYPAFEQPWPRRPWTQPAPGMEGMSNEHQWGGPPMALPYPHYPEWGEADPRRGWPVPQPRPEQEMPVYPPQKSLETPNVFTSNHALRDSPKKGLDLMKDPPQPVVQVKEEKVQKLDEGGSKKKELKLETPAPPVKTQPPVVEKKPAPPSAHQHYAVMDDHDGLSEPPPAAVMLLILGVLMTSVMGVMLACRARAVRRRLRRGKSSLAHDADYLVNGMYL